MAALLLNAHNAWLFAGQEVHELYGVVTMTVGTQRDVTGQTDWAPFLPEIQTPP